MDAPAALARLPSHGWVAAPSPLTSLDGLARHLGLESLRVKRDDLLEGLHGGTKVRKLDVLLAEPPFVQCPRFCSLGAIGSGHLAACTAAAQALGKQLDAYLFREPLSAGVLDNLAFVASGPTRLHYFGSRLEIAWRKPSLELAASVDGAPRVHRGASVPAGVAGVVRAGFELAAQLQAEGAPPPDAVYVALGSGGTAAGLALGLGLAGLRCELVAVSTVERPFISAGAVRRLVQSTCAWLAARGVPASPGAALSLRVVRSQLGPGYAVPTAQSLAAVELLRQEGVPLEPVYTGKAFAGLLADAAKGRAGRRVLFWNTVGRHPLPRDDAWRAKLPPRLLRHLDQATRPDRGRRRLLWGGAAVLGAAAVARVTGYPDVPGWAGQVLSPREALVVAAAAEVLTGVPGVDGRVVAANVDRFLVPLPPAVQGEIHQLLALVEHGTGLGLRLARFTRLEPDARLAFLLSLAARGGLLAQAARGLRDLCLMGTYQLPASWAGTGYGGPWKPDLLGPANAGVDPTSFRAPPGALPR